MSAGKTGDKKFGGHYDDWREKRINKIISIIGDDWFLGKKILELGCGWGDIGKHFKDMGASVTFTDARNEHLTHVRKHSPNSEAIQLDQDTNWNLQVNFDLIIHMGVLYHLSNWKQDLRCAFNHADNIILETVVANNESDSFEHSFKEKGWDQSIHNVSIRPSAAHLEKFLGEIGVTFTRFDDSDINSGRHQYDWSVDDSTLSTTTEDNQRSVVATRRFYFLKKRK